MKNISQTGFTIIELMMVLFVVGILVGIASPSMQVMIERNRTEAQLNAIYSTLLTARSEAISRNQPAVICKSADRSACTTSGNWEQGWLLYIDADDDGTFDASEELITSKGALHTGFTLRAASPLNNVVSFRANGTTNSTGSMKLCPPSEDTDHSYNVVLSMTGRARVSSEVVSCP
ncbi:type IV fimbrial biogenesis protein FimT [Alteromonadaceae bacterium 2753L.S.0a.02]|nr:type IV fimbrial biogenesis protein FimT [Alteromonadaceae bacterium 2753L.S.0a.02]